MSALSIQPPYPAFAGTDGLPLENGYIWIGTVNLNPQVNPIAVYWDAALIIPAAQPIRTLNGYPMYQGTPARFYAASDYSILGAKQQRQLGLYVAERQSLRQQHYRIQCNW